MTVTTLKNPRSAPLSRTRITPTWMTAQGLTCPRPNHINLSGTSFIRGSQNR
jgi:hypothetical protein